MKNNIALEEESLKELIRVLQEARKAGFSSPSSAIELYFEATIDLNLRISLLLREGVLGVKNNKQIKFLESAQDALGNPLQISWRKPSKFYWEPIAEKLLSDYASLLVHLKNQTSIISFLEKGPKWELSKHPRKRERETATQNKQKQKLRKNASYNRRQRIKRRP